MRTSVLVALASAFGMSDALRRACRVNPANRGEGWYYTTSFDTVQNVAADFCTSPAVINKWNNLNGNIRAGMNLKVPCHQVTRDCARDSNSANGAYTVRTGDDLTKIAKDFCTNSATLASMNKGIISNPDVIFAGTVISVPCSWN